jgi:hypothetical protein
MKRHTKLIGILSLIASAVALGATSRPAQATLPAVNLPSFEKTPRPDLVVSSILTTWTQFTVANVGTAPAGPFTIALGPRSEGGICPLLWTAIRINSLAVGGSVQVDAGSAVDTSREQARPSNWARWIWVDANDEVLERGESSATRTWGLLGYTGNNLALLPGQFYPCPGTVFPI